MNDSEKLAAIIAILNPPVYGTQVDVYGVAPGPGIVPTPAPAPLNFWRNPRPLPDPDPATGLFPTCYDDLQTALLYAADCIKPTGEYAWLEPDAEKVRELCDYIAADTTTAEQAEARLKGSGNMDRQTACFGALTGWMQGFPPGGGGAPSLFTVKGRIVDLIHAPGTSTPSGKPV